MTNEEAVKVMQTVWAAGFEVAKNMKPGDVFKGAIPEAEARGYTSEFERGVFIAGYMHKLQRPVQTDHDGLIVKLGK